MDKDKLIYALVLQMIATGQMEGVWYGPKWTEKLINEYIDSTGGWEFWENQLTEEDRKEAGRWIRL